MDFYNTMLLFYTFIIIIIIFLLLLKFNNDIYNLTGINFKNYIDYLSYEIFYLF